MKHLIFAVLIAAAPLLTEPSLAADDARSLLTSEGHITSGSLVDVQTVLKEVSKKIGKQFVLDPRIPSKIDIGMFEPKQITYPVLLVILHNYGYVAISVQGIVNVVPEQEIRNSPTPTIFKDESGIADYEVVTRLIHLTNANGMQLVPFLRPCVSQNGNLSAYSQTNTLLITDYYANVKRVVELAQAIDKAPIITKQTESKTGQ